MQQLVSNLQRPITDKHNMDKDISQMSASVDDRPWHSIIYPHPRTQAQIWIKRQGCLNEAKYHSLSSMEAHNRNFFLFYKLRFFFCPLIAGLRWSYMSWVCGLLHMGSPSLCLNHLLLRRRWQSLFSWHSKAAQIKSFWSSEVCFFLCNYPGNSTRSSSWCLNRKHKPF